MPIVVIILTCILLYWRTLKFDLVVDDIRHRGHLKTKPKHWFYGFYGTGTLGFNTWRDHALAIALHAVICVLMYIALGPVAGDSVAFWAAMLYACNPANNQTSIWLNGRRYAVIIILTLLMLVFKPWGLALYFITPFYHVTAILAPILLGPAYSLAVLAALAVGWRFFWKRYQGRMKEVLSDDFRFFRPKRLIVCVKIYGFYCNKMIFPGITRMINPHFFGWGLTDKGNKRAYSFNWMFWRGIAYLAASIAGGFFFKGDLLYMWAFMCLSTLQWSGFFSGLQEVADRYISLPNVFMMFFVSYFVHVYLGFYWLAVILPLMAYYISRLSITMLMYRNILLFYDYHMFFNMDDIPCRFFKAQYLLKTGDPLGAWELIKQGLERHPDDHRMLAMAAKCCQVLRDPTMALKYIVDAEQNMYLGDRKNPTALAEITNLKNQIIGVDLDKEMQLIREKKSPRPKAERDRIIKMYEAVERQRKG